MAKTPASPAPKPTPSAASQTPAVAQRESFLESLRTNRVGALTAGLVIGLAVALLLSVLVPNEPNLLALILLGVFEAAAVGFTVRYLSDIRGLFAQATALVLTVVGVHVMTVTGMASGNVPFLAELGGASPAFDDAVLISFATPAIAVGPFIAGLIAAIIVGWGKREPVATQV